MRALTCWKEIIQHCGFNSTYIYFEYVFEDQEPETEKSCKEMNEGN